MRRRVSISVSVATETIGELHNHLENCEDCRHYGEALDHLVKLARAYRKLREYQGGA